jgi:alpha-amylase/alpha-mannosidase (GH57 family)
MTIDRDANLKEIAARGKAFTEEDKEYVVSKQREILGSILPLYRKLLKAGRIEITATPYYHPILPLLCDTSVARVSMPSARLPRKRFAHPEDASWQVAEAIRYHTEQFGTPARGMWPSEGSISEEALEILISKGIDWIAADEDILFKSLSAYDRKYKTASLFDRRMIYKPYSFKKDSRHINIVFRDKNLSDLVSFNYNSWEPVAAAEDLLGHFRRVAENLRRNDDTGLLTIVMDGENAWEYYEDNARAFFEHLYFNLDRDEMLASTTVSDYLAVEPPRKTLSGIFPGSWINHNFDIWIGQEQDNLSWEYLSRTRRDLVKFTKLLHKKESGGADIQKAWRELYIAEGSDWNWWYAGKVGTNPGNPFDRLYRMHLGNVYRYLEKKVPDFLKISIA